MFIQEEVEEGNSGGEVNISNLLIIIVIVITIALNQVKKTCFDHMNNSFLSTSQANLPSSQGSISPPLDELAEVNQVGSKEAMGWNILCRGL